MRSLALLAMLCFAPAVLGQRNVTMDALGCQIQITQFDPDQRYAWHGPCSGGKAHGPGYLLLYFYDGAKKQPFNPHIVYGVNMRGGRLSTPVTEYTSFFNWVEWRVVVYHDLVAGAPTGTKGPGFREVPRHMVPAEMQEGLNHFANRLNIPGYIALPVERNAARCPGVLDVTAASGAPVKFDVQAFMRANGEKAKEVARHKVYDYERAAETRAIDVRLRNLGPSYQRIAAAVYGCS